MAPGGFAPSLLRLVAVLVACCSSARCAITFGSFELRLVGVSNPRSELRNGACCGSAAAAAAARKRDECAEPCRTYFSVCLKEYQAVINLDSPCTFGSRQTNVLGGSSFELSNSTGGYVLSFPFEFAWTKLCTLVVEARDWGSDGSIVQLYSQQLFVLPRQEWLPLAADGGGYSATMLLGVRVRCSPGYYNDACQQFCAARDDELGHYTCGESGAVVCLPGWTGEYCTTSLCRQGCSPKSGTCSVPGECRCNNGWTGPLCDACQLYPGCGHGSCFAPYQCICDEGWGGELCNTDLNPCRLKPCQNGGHCYNMKSGDYSCDCLNGHSGRDCEIAPEVDCNANSSRSCANGGQCEMQSVSSGVLGDIRLIPRCICRDGWTGSKCDVDVDECSLDDRSPCQNGGVCRNTAPGFICTCPLGWQGPLCQLQADLCLGSPCRNARSCRAQRDGYVCECLPGWSGRDCDTNADDCATSPCLNRATCVDRVAGFTCVCSLGFAGSRCEHEIDECATAASSAAAPPCLNGGHCDDLIGGYECRCPSGFAGSRCEIDTDPCSPDPCQNDARCLALQNGRGYHCQCALGFIGKNCQEAIERLGLASEAVRGCPDGLPAANATSAAATYDAGLCSGHGTCESITASGMAQCSCKPGYSGARCEIDTDDCASRPCENGGTCLDRVDGFVCVCRSGWQGTLCEIDKVDCSFDVCKNGGTCTDLENDYACRCIDGWKGRKCQLRNSYCDASTCLHGGTCVDLGDDFRCNCTTDRQGRVCQEARRQPCDGGPCLNGATCVNGPSSSAAVAAPGRAAAASVGYMCSCSWGFEGQRCERNIDDCSRHPCLNGGTCVDGIGSYICRCPAGFAGYACEDDINECLSSPCGIGSACINVAGSFRCVCPAGRRGDLCDEMDGTTAAGAPDGGHTAADEVHRKCVYSRRLYAHGESWRQACLECRCSDADVTCHKMDSCGPATCVASTNGSSSCPDGEACDVIDAPKVDCLVPPCVAWGVCVKATTSAAGVAAAAMPLVSYAAGGGGVAAPPDVKCQCNAGTDAILNNNCARVELTFDPRHLPVGASASSVCRLLRERTRIAAYWLPERGVRLTCGLRTGDPRTVEVMVYTGAGEPLPDEGATAVSGAVQDIDRSLQQLQSRGGKDEAVGASSADGVFRAVTSLTLSVAPSVSKELTDTKYLVPLACGFTILAGFAVLATLVCCHLRLVRRLRVKQQRDCDSLLSGDDKDGLTVCVVQNNRQWSQQACRGGGSSESQQLTDPRADRPSSSSLSPPRGHLQQHRCHCESAEAAAAEECSDGCVRCGNGDDAASGFGGECSDAVALDGGIPMTKLAVKLPGPGKEDAAAAAVPVVSSDGKLCTSDGKGGCGGSSETGSTQRSASFKGAAANHRDVNVCSKGGGAGGSGRSAFNLVTPGEWSSAERRKMSNLDRSLQQQQQKNVRVT